MRDQPRSPLTLNLPHQVEISKKLVDLGYELCEGVELQVKRKDLIFLALVDKCFVTSVAIRTLCEQALVDDAFALTRVLIEAVISASYILESDDQVAEDYADYPKFFAWKQFQDVEAVAPEITSDATQEERERMKKDYEATRERYEKNRNTDWTKDNIFARARMLDTVVGFNLFRSLINVGWRTAGAYVHSTASSLTSRLSEDEKHVTIRRTATPQEAAGALYTCNMAMFALVAAVDLRLGKKKVDIWKELYGAWSGTSASKSPVPPPS